MSTVLPKVSIPKKAQMHRDKRNGLDVPRGTLKLCLKRLRLGLGLDSFADEFCANDSCIGRSVSSPKI